MRYYFHIVTDRERLRDPDGEEFSSLDSAREEATQSARDLIAEKLRCGQAVPSRWRIQIALEDETIVETVPFTPLLLGHEAPPPVPGRVHREVIARARAATVEIRSHLTELRNNLTTLSQLNEGFSKHCRD